VEKLAYNFLENNPCEIMVVSLGPQGALLVTHETSEYIPSPLVYTKSTIGAGDSMVAGMVFALAQGKSISEMARFGVACGTAATMTPGTQLCRKEDVEHLYNWMESQDLNVSRTRIKA
jgi:6-phosphofructokinase 2